MEASIGKIFFFYFFVVKVNGRATAQNKTIHKFLQKEINKKFCIVILVPRSKKINLFCQIDNSQKKKRQ
jgi:hypothetical protein